MPSLKCQKATLMGKEKGNNSLSEHYCTLSWTLGPGQLLYVDIYFKTIHYSLLNNIDNFLNLRMNVLTQSFYWKEVLFCVSPSRLTIIKHYVFSQPCLWQPRCEEDMPQIIWVPLIFSTSISLWSSKNACESSGFTGILRHLSAVALSFEFSRITEEPCGISDKCYVISMSGVLLRQIILASSPADTDICPTIGHLTMLRGRTEHPAGPNLSNQMQLAKLGFLVQKCSQLSSSLLCCLMYCVFALENGPPTPHRNVAHGSPHPSSG